MAIYASREVFVVAKDDDKYLYIYGIWYKNSELVYAVFRRGEVIHRTPKYSEAVEWFNKELHS